MFPSTYHSKMVRFKKLTREEALSHVSTGNFLSQVIIYSLINRVKNLWIVVFLMYRERLTDFISYHFSYRMNSIVECTLTSYNCQLFLMIEQYACRLHCLMCIAPTYPSVPPTFALVLESQGQKRPHSHWIKVLHTVFCNCWSSLLQQVIIDSTEIGPDT